MNHQIVYHQEEKYPYACAICRRTWGRQPHDQCLGKPCYYWEQGPAHLRTFTQLRRERLKPRDRREPDAYLWCHDAWWDLYDQREALPRRRMTTKQREALAAAWTRTQAKYTCAFCGAVPRHLADLKRFSLGACRWCRQRLHEYDDREADRAHAQRVARQLLAHPEQAAIVDCETTALHGEPVQVAVVDLAGSVLFDSFIKPRDRVTPDARAIHHITDAELEHAPSLADVWSSLQQALAGRSILLAYNAAFDAGILDSTARRAGLEALPHHWICLMELYAAFCGEWSEKHQSYRWQKLSGGHRALEDCQAALAVLRAMAAPDEDRPSPEELLLAELGENTETFCRKPELSAQVKPSAPADPPTDTL